MSIEHTPGHSLNDCIHLLPAQVSFIPEPFGGAEKFWIDRRGTDGPTDRLRLELAGELGATDIAREGRKRLAAIEKSRTFVSWQNRRPLVDDLEGQRRAIGE